MIEICDNAKDDDGDGLIDLNDPDCKCAEAKPISLIPNPSFEEMDCCPDDRSQLNCASGWIQASEATTDYLNTCGWMGWERLPPPLPFPDGKGVIGFRNGLFGDTIQPNFKEYAGACLLSPMFANTTYRFRFNIGFLDAVTSPPTTVVFYGTSDCSKLPFGVGNIGFGCPLNGEGWQELGKVKVQGLHEWKEENITITPREDIVAIAIGPDCEPISATSDIYYFLDNLILGEKDIFKFEVSVTGQPCSDEFALQLPPSDFFQYQWYKNGIALIGETQPKLYVQYGEGDYQVRILGEDQCLVTPPYHYHLDIPISKIEQTICKNERYIFNNQQLSKSGIYWDTLKTSSGCDSLVRLSLSVVNEKIDTLRVKVFEGESYQLGNVRYSRPGEHDIVLRSFLGCDSLVHLDLDFYHVYFPTAFSPNGDGSNDAFTIFGGDDLMRIDDLQIFDRWGNRVFQKRNFNPNDIASGWDGQFKGKPAQIGVYVYTSLLLMEDGMERQFSGSMILIR